MSSDRDRLIELLSNKQQYGIATEEPPEAIYTIENHQVADHLLANGVIVPPCNVGDMVYVIKYCRCGNPEAYELKHCHKKDTKKTPKVLGSIMKQQYGMRPSKNYDWHKGRGFVWQPIGTICYKIIQKPFKLEWLIEIGKTVFLTREEAEAELRKRSEQNA